MMPRIGFLAVLTTLALLVLPGSAAWAQSCGEGECYYEYYQPVDPGGPTFIPPLVIPQPGGGGGGSGGASDPGRTAVVALTDANAFCAAVSDGYQVDCLAERMAAAARQLPRDGAYAESRAALETAAAKLAALARQNADPAKPRQRYSAPSMPRPVTTDRPLTAVAPARQPAVNAAALEILAEAETVLLRSSATAVAEAPQIQRIAAAVDSNKVLLRSA